MGWRKNVRKIEVRVSGDRYKGYVFLGKEVLNLFFFIVEGEEGGMS